MLNTETRSLLGIAADPSWGKFNPPSWHIRDERERGSVGDAPRRHPRGWWWVAAGAPRRPPAAPPAAPRVPRYTRGAAVSARNTWQTNQQERTYPDPAEPRRPATDHSPLTHFTILSRARQLPTRRPYRPTATYRWLIITFHGARRWKTSRHENRDFSEMREHFCTTFE